MAEALYVGGKARVGNSCWLQRAIREPARVIEPYPQNGTMGCYTASAAFIHTYLSGERIEPAELDAYFGRQPDEPIKAVGNIALWLLEKGHAMTSYLQDSQATVDYLDASIPDHRTNNAIFETCRQRGQFTVAQEVITPTNLERRIGTTGIAIGAIEAFPGGPVHSQVLFKHDGRLNVYDPGIDESYIWPAGNLAYVLDYTNPVAIWRA